ncbi:hypothetical protein N9937_00495 [bacterium]|nr:hypothetical protein [bacterium]
MAVEDMGVGQVRMTKLASEDMSAYVNRFVTASGDYVKLASTRSKIMGVLVNKPTALGASAQIVIFGKVKLCTDGSVTAFDLLMSDASGYGTTATQGNGSAVESGGWALDTDGGAGSIVEIMHSRMPMSL